MKKSTSWEKSAEWYNQLLESGKGTYQKEVILPNLLRLMNIKKGEIVLDLACGQGFFSREFARAGAKVIGVDLSPKLIELAKENSPKDIKFYVAPADKLDFFKDNSVDKTAIILSLQNIENVHQVLKEISRVLKKDGKVFMVLNHPAFRIPKQSSWGFDEKEKTQYRRIDQYLSESKAEIEMHPGSKEKEETLSFHRPLQYYFKLLGKNGFVVSRLEEWVSNKKSGPGPRQKVEDKARHEIPLFLFLEAVKIS